jgi:hypothetical protein
MFPFHCLARTGFLILGQTAVASSYRGMSWGILFVFYTLPFVIIPLVTTIVLASFSAFRRPVVFYCYTGVITLVALFFLTMAANAPGSVGGSLLVVAEVIVVYLLTVVPTYRQFKSRSSAEQRMGK